MLDQPASRRLSNAMSAALGDLKKRGKLKPLAGGRAYGDTAEGVHMAKTIDSLIARGLASRRADGSIFPLKGLRRFGKQPNLPRHGNRDQDRVG